MTSTDFEYLLLSLLLILGVLLNVKKMRTNSTACSKHPSFYCLVLTKEMSIIAKGICCIMILMAHYVPLKLGTNIHFGISKVVYVFFANIALFVFMFISGYGLSEKQSSCLSIGSDFLNRLKKVYLPLLFSMLATSILYFTICNTKIDVGNVLEKNSLYKYISNLCCNFNIENVVYYIKDLVLIDDWYVLCIIYFYSIFYFSRKLADICKIDFTKILAIGLLVYFLLARVYYGFEEGHFFRYQFPFFLGHLVSKYKNNDIAIASFDIVALIVLSITILYHGYLWLAYALIAILFIMFLSYVENKYKYNYYNILYRIGLCSYFFYLIHIRIGYVIFSMAEYNSVLLWLLITLSVSLFLNFIYGKFKNFIFFK